MTRFLRPRSTVAALLSALAAGALGACGGGGGGGATASSDPNTLLAQTFGPRQTVHSGRLAMSLDLNLQGTKTFSGPLSIKLNGPFQGHGAKTPPDLKLTLLLASAAQNFSAGVTTTNGKAWVQFAGQDYLVPDSVFSQFRSSYLKSASSGSGQSSLGRFGIDPRNWLTGARTVGHEQVAGSDTIHVTAGVNVVKLLGDFSTLLGKTATTTSSAVPNAPKGISPATQAAIASATKSATVDVYSGSSDHGLRRLKIALKLSTGAAQRAQLRGLQGGTFGFDLQFSELNKTEQIPAPTNAKPLNLLSNGLAGAGAAAAPAPAGGSGSSAPPAGGASGAGVAAPSPYLNCVTKAAGNVAAIQKCQSLISGGK